MARKKGGKKKNRPSGVQTEEPPQTEQTQFENQEAAPVTEEISTPEEKKEPVLTDAVSEVLGDKKDESSGKKEKKSHKKIKTQIAKYAADGHDVSGLEALLETASSSQLKDALKTFEAGVESNGKIKDALSGMKPEDLESDVEALNQLLADPLKYEEAAKHFEAVKFKSRSTEIISALNKMVLPIMKPRVETLKAMLQNSQDQETIENEFYNLKRDYKEAYAEEGVKAQIISAQPETVKEAPRARMPMVVKDIFLLYRDGKFISHHTNRVVSKEQQKELFADLKTGRDFLRSPKYVPQKLNVIPGQSRNVLVQSGRFTVVIIVAEGSVDPWSEKITGKVISLMEKEDQMQLKDWNGDVSALKNSGKYMQALLFAFLKLAKKGA
ncbi:MAG: hypothetical protein KKH41_08355 [Candidatus Thermoplasmatota archaeon]|nr:hypothetical protein [Euryarchaeota archaeon]MBU4032690.1 hypothetical protein [Candidatus Thermoplasmatota archaeon]MBU4070846.1 hypothetical protein [Candidatus Thermoplasmatota archaeon]MBU4143611.1 hypothetical protein [Candidatus Thermoplasmatota archaeon]MBU4592576.1 hypothetical protein [Candidatus Thermoplasmatota archaeon]